jgi:hypothetical protein
MGSMVSAVATLVFIIVIIQSLFSSDENQVKYHLVILPDIWVESLRDKNIETISKSNLTSLLFVVFSNPEIWNSKTRKCSHAHYENISFTYPVTLNAELIAGLHFQIMHYVVFITFATLTMLVLIMYHFRAEKAEQFSASEKYYYARLTHHTWL